MVESESSQSKHSVSSGSGHEMQVASAANDQPGNADVQAKRRQTVLRNLNKLRGLIPVASGVLNLVDHSAAQALARVLPLFAGAPTATTQTPPHKDDSAEEIAGGILDLQSDSRELLLQLQGHSVQMKRLDEQLAYVRENSERDRAAVLALGEDVHSLNRIVKGFGAAFLLMLVLLLTMGVFLLLHSRQ